MTGSVDRKRHRHRRCLAQLPPLGRVEVARLFGWIRSSPIPLSFEGRGGVVKALMEADKGEGRDLGEEVVGSLIPGRKETKKNQSWK